MVAGAVHPVKIQSAAFGPRGPAKQLILERSDEDFIAAVLDELKRSNGAADLLRTVASAKTANNILKLYQPVQRVSNVALFEVICDVPGQPRFDPARIESAGMVVRRVWRDASDIPHFDRHEGWRQDGPALKGWVSFDTPAELELDPDPAQRAVPRIGHPEIDRRLALLRGEKDRLAEASTPLFKAPPEVCGALGKTILFGVIPVASAEQSEVPTVDAYKPSDVDSLLSPMLKATAAGMNFTVPRPNEWLGPDDADDPRLAPYVSLLRQLVLELDAFGASTPSTQLFAALERIQIPLERPEPDSGQPYDPTYYPNWPKRSAGEMLRQHAAVLVSRDASPTLRPGVPWPGYPRIQMPPAWAPVTADAARAIAAAAKTALDARMAAVIQPRAPRYDQRKRAAKLVRPGRYDETGPMYRVRPFARVRHHDDCPAHLVWGEPSDAFAIAPWYEAGGAPPVQVALPDPTDQSFLKSLKPNVAFSVPGNLFDTVQKNDPAELLKGKGSSGSMEIDWICAFNIPTITICAFILLSIILSILDIFLHWMAFVKICIPVPRKT